jgi:hypothetical protein
MLRKGLVFVALAAVAGLVLAGCSGNGPSDPNDPGMPMQVVAADSVAR